MMRNWIDASSSILIFLIYSCSHFGPRAYCGQDSIKNYKQRYNFIYATLKNFGCAIEADEKKAGLVYVAINFV